LACQILSVDVCVIAQLHDNMFVATLPSIAKEAASAVPSWTNVVDWVADTTGT